MQSPQSPSELRRHFHFAEEGHEAQGDRVTFQEKIASKLLQAGADRRRSLCPWPLLKVSTLSPKPGESLSAHHITSASGRCVCGFVRLRSSGVGQCFQAIFWGGGLRRGDVNVYPSVFPSSSSPGGCAHVHVRVMPAVTYHVCVRVTTPWAGLTQLPRLLSCEEDQRDFPRA